MQVSLGLNLGYEYSEYNTIDKKERWDDGVVDGYPSRGYTLVSTEQNLNGGGGTHSTIEMGTESMLIDVGANGYESTNESVQELYWEYGNGAQLPDEDIVIDNLYGTDTSAQDYTWGIKLGGDVGFEFIDEHNFDMNIRIQEEESNRFNGELSMYTWDTVFINYSGEPESESTPDPIYRVTETFTSPGEEDVITILEESDPAVALPPDLGGGGDQTADEILADYEAHKQQLYHLQALLEVTTMPTEIALIQGQIAMQEQIIAGIEAEAELAGISDSQLETADQAASDASDADPPTWTSLGDLGLDDIDTNAPGWYHFLTNPSDMEGDLQTGFYTFLGIGGGALALAGGLAAWPAIAGSSTSFHVPTGFAWVTSAEGTVMLAATGTTVTVTGTQAATATGLAAMTALFAKLVEVDIRKLHNPPSRLHADPQKLKDQGKFDINKYTPAEVIKRRSGSLQIQNGVTRIENALRAGVFYLKVIIQNVN